MKACQYHQEIMNGIAVCKADRAVFGKLHEDRLMALTIRKGVEL